MLYTHYSLLMYPLKVYALASNEDRVAEPEPSFIKFAAGTYVLTWLRFLIVGLKNTYFYDSFHKIFNNWIYEIGINLIFLILTFYKCRDWVYKYKLKLIWETEMEPTKEGRGRRCFLGERIDSIPCRSSYFTHAQVE